MPKNVIGAVANYMPTPFVSFFMQNVVAHYYDKNRYNEVYRKRNDLTWYEKEIIDAYINSLKSSMPQILDIGCGAGVPFDSYFSKAGCGVIGIDISKAQIDKARVNVPSAKYVNIDFLKYHDNKHYDGIVLLYSLFHIQREHHQFVMEKVYDLLEPQGKVLLNIRVEDCGKLKYKKDFCGKPMCWSHYDSDKFLNIAEQVGFKYNILGDEKSYGSSESHLWIILNKAM